MEYRRLGRTDLAVSVLGLGGAPLGHIYGQIDEAEGERAVRTAFDLGINFVDVSPYYGNTRAETVLGRALRGVPRDTYVLATKTGRYDVGEFDFSPERIRSSLDESLGRLGVETVDLFQLHDVEFASLEEIVEVSAPTMEELKREGKIRYWGVTGLPLKMFRIITARSKPDSILSYCHHTLADDTLKMLIPEMQAQGIGVINASPTGMGLLTESGPPEWHPADKEIQACCRSAAAWCAGRGIDLARVALQFAASHPGVATTLTGTASPEILTQIVSAVAEPLDPGLLRDVRARLDPIRDRTWGQGRPENN